MAQDRGSEFLRYLAERRVAPGERLPAIQELAHELGVSTGKLREQLEVARQLGLVEIRPKTGIRTCPYDFFPSIWTSLSFALRLDPAAFEHFEALRNHLEASFFLEAARRLTAGDKAHLRQLIARAWKRLEGDPIQIPHAEHRELHMTIYRRLDNPFLQGLLEAYWEAYENVGLNLYTDYSFLHEVWTYHARMVQEILEENYEAAQRTLVDHTALLHKRPRLARGRSANSSVNGREARRRVKQGVAG
ncbi:MAG: FCD domain-containing protein [Chloroflexota bacterium]